MDDNATTQKSPQKEPRLRDYKETYFLCHNLIMKVEAVVMNRQEEIIGRQVITSMSEVFREADKVPGL